VIALSEAYLRLARPWTTAEIGDRFREALGDAPAEASTGEDPQSARPIGALALAIPSCASLAVAVHVLHVVPEGADDELANQLLTASARNAAEGIRHCHRSLELDAAAQGYSAEAWLPVVYENAAPLLESARATDEPPTIVTHVQAAVSWLSQAFVELDSGAAETSSALAGAIAHLLAIWVFAEVALGRTA